MQGARQAVWLEDRDALDPTRAGIKPPSLECPREG